MMRATIITARSPDARSNQARLLPDNAGPAATAGLSEILQTGEFGLWCTIAMKHLVGAHCGLTSFGATALQREASLVMAWTRTGAF